VPTRYPAGGAKQLIRVLTGKEVPASKRSTELGVQCFNVATVLHGLSGARPRRAGDSRIVTLTGNVEQPRNWEVRLGTPMRELLALGQPKADTDRYLMGGPMMGFEMPSLDAPVVKATNCIIAGSPTLFPPSPPEMPCIRCGACAEVCPHELQPFELYWFSRARNFGKTQEYHIFDCIECGCCSYVCPSHIPLVQYFRFAKSEIWSREREKNAPTPPRRASNCATRATSAKGRESRTLAKAAAARRREASGGSGGQPLRSATAARQSAAPDATPPRRAPACARDAVDAEAQEGHHRRGDGTCARPTRSRAAEEHRRN
jgi:electron transport complex protein RnfC